MCLVVGLLMFLVYLLLCVCRILSLLAKLEVGASDLEFLIQLFYLAVFWLAFRPPRIWIQILWVWFGSGQI